MTFGGVTVAPKKLGRTRITEALPMHWLGDSVGQKMEGRFPMVGNARDQSGDNRVLGQIDRKL
jgi:hypothetical protein